MEPARFAPATPILELYRQYRNAVAEDAHPVTKSMPLLDETYSHVLVLSAMYLLFIHYGTKYMSGRKPFGLRKTMLVYNMSLTVLSLYTVVELGLSAYWAGYNLGCVPIGDNAWNRPEDNRVARATWLYFFSKAIELMDTVLMVLRKKANQISFLHVYHHLFMVNIWWWVATFAPVGSVFFGPLCNSAVHVFMYSYYALSTFESLRPYLWWKRYITQIQLIQFVLILIQATYLLVKCPGYPRWVTGSLGLFLITMLILFGDFYLKSYKTKSSQKRE